LNSAGSYAIYKNVVATNTVGNIQVIVNSTSNNADIYGNSYAPPTTSAYKCVSSSPSQDNFGFYIYTLNCYTPRVGDMWFIVYDSTVGNVTYSITFNTLTCSDASMVGGFNCSSPSVPLNTSTPMTFTMNDTDAALTRAFNYFYYDIPANFSGNQLQVGASALGSTAYLYYRKGGYPEDGTFGYESTSEYTSLSSSSFSYFTLGNFDYFVAGRYYFAIECYGYCNITLSATVLPPNIFTSGMFMTTGSTTAALTTGVMNTTLTTGMTNTTLTTGMMVNTTLTTRAVTSGMNTTLTTRSITSGNMNTTLTTRFMTTGVAGTTGDKESSDVASIVPSFVFALVLALIALF
jgi:hypothetical protein